MGVDAAGLLRLTNRVADELFGYEPRALVGEPYTVLFPPRTRAAHDRLVRACMGGAGRCERQIRARRRDGSEFVADLSLSAASSDGDALVTAVITDVSARVRDDARLHRMTARATALAQLSAAALEGAEPEALMRRTVDIVRSGLPARRASLLEIEPDGTHLRLSAGSGWPPAMLGKTVGTLDVEETEPRVPDLRGYGIQSSAAAWVQPRGLRVAILAAHADRDEPFSRDAERFVDEAAGVLARALERHDSERRLRHQALYDPLTGLANRMLFVERLEHWLSRASREHERAAVFFLDLDGFKDVNDSFGHAGGDQVLRVVGQRIASTVRESATVARLSGDEFGVLLEGLHSGRDALVVASRIQQALRPPIRIGNSEVSLSASIGIALSGPRAPSTDVMVRNADAAMYAAKRGGRARTRIFDREMHAIAIRRLRSERSLRQAIEGNDFAVLYQPIVHLDDGRLAGFEALVRWRRRGRLVSPSHFIPLAEETALIVPLGHKTLAAACGQAAAWQQRFADHPAARVSVNLSRRELAAPGMVRELTRVLADTGLDPGRLSLEIGERTLTGSDDGLQQTLRDLRETGVRLVLDDFGENSASLAQLRRHAISGLKIDGGCIGELLGHADRRAIVAAATTMASALAIDVTAEGVETADQQAMLRKIGCRFGQGYFFAKPFDADSATAALRHAAPRDGAGLG